MYGTEPEEDDEIFEFPLYVFNQLVKAVSYLSGETLDVERVDTLAECLLELSEQSNCNVYLLDDKVECGPGTTPLPETDYHFTSSESDSIFIYVYRKGDTDEIEFAEPIMFLQKPGHKQPTHVMGAVPTGHSLMYGLEDPTKSVPFSRADPHHT